MVPGINDGQPVDASNSNAAWIAKNGDDATVGRLDLNNTNPASGGFITNLQRNINAAFSFMGGVVDQVFNYLPTWTNNQVGLSTDDLKDRAEALTERFDGSSGHAHTGVDGQGPKVAAPNLDNFNNFMADWQEFTKDTVSGTTTDITTQMSGKTPGGATALAGVITTAPNNRVIVQDKETEDNIEDAEGQKVYGRITEAAGVWTLSFFTNEAGTETAHSLASQNIRVFFREVFTMETRPTIPSSLANMPSLDYTADVVDASTTQRGLVSTGTQTFGGTKTFQEIVKILSTGGASESDILEILGTTAPRFKFPASSNVTWRIGSTNLMTLDFGGKLFLSDAVIIALSAQLFSNRLDINNAAKLNWSTIPSAGTSAFRVNDTLGTNDHLSMWQIDVNKVSNIGQIIKAFLAQTADLKQFRDSTDAVLSGFDKIGLLYEKEQSVTPSNPPSGFRKIYPKTDGFWYSLSPTGTETRIGGSGGGSSVEWYEDADAPLATVENRQPVYLFPSNLINEQFLYALIKVPNDYTPGNQIKLRSSFYSPDNTGTLLMTTRAFLKRPEIDTVDQEANFHDSTNTAVTLSAGTVNEAQKVLFDLTTASGQINSIAVSPNDEILVRLKRGTDTAASDHRFRKGITEVSFT